MLEKYFARIRERRALRMCLREFDRYRDNRPSYLIKGRWF